MKKNLKPVAHFSHVIEAQIAQNYLVNEGIDCCIDDQFIVEVNWLFSNLVGGVKLMVPEEDVARAEELLKNIDAQKEDESSGLECPSCRSTNTELATSNKKGIALLILFLSSIPLPFLTKEKWHCKSCGYSWSYRVGRNIGSYLIPIIFVVGLYAIISLICKALGIG